MHIFGYLAKIFCGALAAKVLTIDSDLFLSQFLWPLRISNLFSFYTTSMKMGNIAMQDLPSYRPVMFCNKEFLLCADIFHRDKSNTGKTFLYCSRLMGLYCIANNKTLWKLYLMMCTTDTWWATEATDWGHFYQHSVTCQPLRCRGFHLLATAKRLMTWIMISSKIKTLLRFG